jgi:hypothetical protein
MEVEIRREWVTGFSRSGKSWYYRLAEVRSVFGVEPEEVDNGKGMLVQGRPLAGRPAPDQNKGPSCRE